MEGRGNGRSEGVINRDVFGTQDDLDTEVAGSVVEEFGFLIGSGGAPGGGVGLNFRRCQNDGIEAQRR